MTGPIRRMRRRKLVRQPFPEPWEVILERQVPFYKHLCGRHRRRYLELLKIFVKEKYFIGAGGMQITDEVRVVISACAVRLVRSLGLSYYDRLTEIIVYPYTFTHGDQDVGLLGEAQDWGTVVLSWPAVIEGLAHPQSGCQAVAIHEFAHVLDRTDGVFDGTPRLKARSDYHPWALVMSRHFLNLRNQAKVESIVLRSYGAFNEAEFFAVATEAFFNTPQVMKRLIPDLYTELRKFYRLDPAAEASIACDAPEKTLF
jgi:Mlc titration factor MtfA (ptsG expression regulator)